MSASADRPGVVGLGIMGRAMARRLLAAGRRPLAWNRSAGPRESLAAEGAEAAPSAAALGRACALLHVSVTDESAVEAALFGPDGALADPAPGGLVIDHSTISARATRALAARAAERGWRWVDAPVSGGRAGAEAGTLVAFIGGAEADAAEAAAAMAPLARRATRMGPLGAGQATKLVNQLIVGGTFALLAEATRLAEANGVDAARLSAALEGGFGDSALLQRQQPRMVAGPETVHGAGAMMLKDLDLVDALARESGVSAPVSGAARQLWRLHVASGWAEADWVTLVETLRGARPRREEERR